jgi:hypothetical protein
MNDRTIFIGDLHGCFDLAIELLIKCQATSSDRIIFLGDYVDRGIHNDKCCDLVREIEQRQGSPAGILGNHEERHLEYDDQVLNGKVLDEAKMPPTHVATRKQLRPEHYEWFRSLPLFIRVPEHNTVAVHAGVYPGRTIEQQKPRHLLHIQNIKPPVEESKWPSKVPDDSWKFWTHFYDGLERIVFGHSVLDRPLLTDKVAGIDGGAVFGYQLHALVLPDNKIVSVQASTGYGTGYRGRGGTRAMLFPIHGDVSTYS